MKNNAIFKVRGIIFKDWKVLLWKDSLHGLAVPWGTMDIWESIQECFKREIFEEIWIQAEQWTLYWVYDHFSKTWAATLISVVYHIVNWEDFLNIDVSKASHGYENEYMKFMDLEEIDQKIIEYGHDIFPYWVYKDIRKTLLSMN